jgi:glycosyltransferase involved in cell wall biosynthesis
MNEPLISVVLIALSRSHLLEQTLKSLDCQTDKDFEVVILDGEAKQATARYVEEHPRLSIRVQPARIAPLGEVMNQGVLMAHGTYLHFAFAGDRYLSPNSIAQLRSLLSLCPDLAFAATLDREGGGYAVSATLTSHLLQQGKSPTLARSCWFRKEEITDLGGFDPTASFRPTYDFLCRLLKKGTPHIVSTSHVLIDLPLLPIDRRRAWGYAKETFFFIQKHFGFKSAVRFLLVNHSLHLARSAWRALQRSFIAEAKTSTFF